MESVKFSWKVSLKSFVFDWYNKSVHLTVIMDVKIFDWSDICCPNFIIDFFALLENELVRNELQNKH